MSKASIKAVVNSHERIMQVGSRDFARKVAAVIDAMRSVSDIMHWTDAMIIESVLDMCRSECS